MGWGKIILVFQAVITLVLGIMFFASSFSSSNVSINLNSANENSFSDLKEKFEIGSYVLLIIAFLELIIISRFV